MRTLGSPHCHWKKDSSRRAPLSEARPNPCGLEKERGTEKNGETENPETREIKVTSATNAKKKAPVRKITEPGPTPNGNQPVQKPCKPPQGVP